MRQNKVIDLRNAIKNRKYDIAREIILDMKSLGFPRSLYDSYQKKIDSFQGSSYAYLSRSEGNIGAIRKTPLVSIIVISYNSTRDLSVLIPSLKKQTYSNWELILVENGDERSDLEAQKFLPNVKFLKLKNPGFAEANNQALELAEGSLILLQNPDTYLHPEALKRLVTCMRQDATCGAVCPLIYFYQPFVKIAFRSSDSNNFCVDLNDYLQSISYKKIFIRTGSPGPKNSIFSINGEIILDLPLPEGTQNIIYDLKSTNPSEAEAGLISVEFTGASIPTFYEKMTSHTNKFCIKITNVHHSASRWLINNAGSGLRDSGQPFDIGFGEEEYGQFTGKFYRDAFCGCSVLLRRELFIKRKIFVTEFFAYFEDSELSHWIIKNGLKILYFSEAKVYHKHSETTTEGSKTWKALVSRSSYLYNQMCSQNSSESSLIKQNKPEFYFDSVNKDLDLKLRMYDEMIDGKSTYEAIAQTDKLIVGIYNSFWTTYGGGEKHALDIAMMASNANCEVYLISELEFSIRELGEYFNLDTTSLKKLVCPVNEFLTQNFDIFVNSTYMSNLSSLAQKSYYVISFPQKTISDKMRDCYHFLPNSQFTRDWAQRYWGTFTSNTLYPVLGFQDANNNSHEDSLKSDGLKNDLKKEKIILSVGRFNYQGHCKNQHLIAETFSSAQKSGKIDSSWKIVFIGSVDYSCSTSVAHFRDVENLLLGCNHELIANAESDTVKQFYAKSSIYVHATGLGIDPNIFPEQHEHFGIAVFDALISGCLPILLKYAGPAEQVSGLSVAKCYSSSAELKIKMIEAIREYDDLSEIERSNLISQIRAHGRHIFEYSKSTGDELFVR